MLNRLHVPFLRLIRDERMRLIPSVTAFLAMASVAVAQPRLPQPLAAGTSSIRGTLTDSLTKAPVAGCEVRAAQTASFRSNFVITGADGSFEFAGIPEGAYFLLISCPSHVTACVQSTDAGSAPCSSITVFRDQQLSGVDFRVAPGAVARGRVVDGAGKPIAKAIVRPHGRLPNGQNFAPQAASTKADGTFELQKLFEGEWRFEVEIPQAPGAPRPPIIYYPGVLTREEAGFVEVITGGVKENITIRVPRGLESTLTVRMPPPDATMTSVAVSIVRPSPLMTQPLELDADGQAVVRGLVAGRYLVTATARQGQQRWVDYQAVDFFEDSIDVSLHLQPAGRIRGRIVTDGSGLPPLSDATVGAAWIDEDVALNPLTPDESTVAVDGTFSIDGLFGRRKLQLIRFDPDWRIQSVLYGRSDVTENGVDIVPNSTVEVTIVVGRR